MTATTETRCHWDPANLLQIIDLDDDCKIQCVGRSEACHAERCRHTMSHLGARAVTDNLVALSEKPPTEVTDEELTALARLCLCEECRDSQCRKVTQRWKPVVARAARHHSQSRAGPHGDEQDLPDELLAYFKSQDSEALAKVDAFGRQLNTEIAATNAEISASQYRIQELQGDLKRAKFREPALTKSYEHAACQVVAAREAERARRAGTLTMLEAINADWRRLDTLVSEIHENAADQVKGSSKMAKRAAEDLGGQLSRAIEETARVNRARDQERTRQRALEVSWVNVERRLWKAKEEIVVAQCLVEDEQANLKLLETTNEGLKQRLHEVVARGDIMAQCEEDRSRVRECLNALNRRLVEARKDFREAQKITGEEVLKRLNKVTSISSARLNELAGHLSDATTAVQKLEETRLALKGAFRQAVANNETLAATNADLRQQVTNLQVLLSRNWHHRLRTWAHNKFYERNRPRRAPTPTPTPSLSSTPSSATSDPRRETVTEARPHPPTKPSGPSPSPSP